MSTKFVHLRVHSEFSITDSLIRIPNLVQHAVKFNQPAIALTDLSNMFGVIKFYKLARISGIKPIIGCDMFVTNEINRNEPYRILVLAKNLSGYHLLCKLLTNASLNNSYNGKPEIKLNWLNNLNDLIILSGGRLGDVGRAIELNNTQLAHSLLFDWKKRCSDNFYIELQRTGSDSDEKYVEKATQLAYEHNLPVVATHPIQFLEEKDFFAHEVRVCISESKIINDPNRSKNFFRSQFFLSSEEMEKRFQDIPSAIRNSFEIAKKCSLLLELGTVHLPKFIVPDNTLSTDEFLVHLAKKGLEQRFSNTELILDRQLYEKRLDQECKTIIEMGFSGYFLIVQDFVNWGKKNNVPVGPGRGSGAGSLVAYALSITDLDPIRYNLIFERFLNPERVTMPDFDIDFCQDGREKVINYVKKKYGDNSVSQIVTFGTFGAKGVLRDVGRTLGMPYSICDELSRLIPFNPTDPWSLTRTLNNNLSFRQRYENEEEIRTLVDLAIQFEGLVKNIGIHAGGILIAPESLTKFCPVFLQQGNIISQFDKDDVEEVGLIKFDFLGLRNLTILNSSERYVRLTHCPTFDLKLIKLDDTKTYKLLSDGNTTGVFQLESNGMKNLLKKLKPNTFEDIIAVLALYRPGPLESGMVEDFVNRKHGYDQIKYLHKDLEKILKNTYGIIVYQEQVMLISQVIGGYSLGKADLLRRAMGKKKLDEMLKHRNLFESGAMEKGYDHTLSIQLFDLMEKFAGYGFNKSHSAAYALIAYQTAWMKANYPAEFFSSTLSADMDDTEKVNTLRLDLLKNNIILLAPDINYSKYNFEPISDINNKNAIRYGLGAIKGLGANVVNLIVETRLKNGKFDSMFDFLNKCNSNSDTSGVISKRTVELLIRAGAFDSIEKNRSKLLSSLQEEINKVQYKLQYHQQFSLLSEQSFDFLKKNDYIEWNLEQTLINEKIAFGYYFSDHPFKIWEEEASQIVKNSIVNAIKSSGKKYIAGILTAIKQMFTKQGKVFFLSLEDNTGKIDIFVTEELLKINCIALEIDKFLLINCTNTINYSDKTKIVVHKVYGKNGLIFKPD